jgi:hypothetical protein
MDARRPIPRRFLLLAPPLAAAGCAGGEEPGPARLVTGYRHLTPIRLNVATIAIADPAPGAVRVAPAAPLAPDAEMRLMAQERLVAMGTEGEARFIIQAAELRRERLPPSGGMAAVFAGEPGERLTVRLNARLEVQAGEGGSAGFVEAEARGQRTLPSGTSDLARRRASEDLVRQTMDQLNVEFEFQIRRALRGWLLEGPSPATAPAPVNREELPRAGGRT